MRIDESALVAPDERAPHAARQQRQCFDARDDGTSRAVDRLDSSPAGDAMRSARLTRQGRSFVESGALTSVNWQCLGMARLETGLECLMRGAV